MSAPETQLPVIRIIQGDRKERVPTVLPRLLTAAVHRAPDPESHRGWFVVVPEMRRRGINTSYVTGRPNARSSGLLSRLVSRLCPVSVPSCIPQAGNRQRCGDSCARQQSQREAAFAWQVASTSPLLSSDRTAGGGGAGDPPRARDRVKRVHAPSSSPTPLHAESGSEMCPLRWQWLRAPKHTLKSRALPSALRGSKASRPWEIRERPARLARGP